ncbi:hypothetical protein LINPERPRIM_LOCUS19525 [Linum perenne]
MLNPEVASMLTVSSPFSSSQSKHCTMAATVQHIRLNAMAEPGHILLPPPNGINPAAPTPAPAPTVPFTRPSSCTNLSGRNSLGSTHTSGSLITENTLIATATPFASR